VSGQEPRQWLAAILAADAAGYSRLMASDERATVAALDAARAVFRGQIESHHGRIIDMAGDSVLAVFETAGGAVDAALAVQETLSAAGSAVAEHRRMHFRIGVHLGDIIEKADGTVYGDGVNIAARLQGIADLGGITVSEAVRGSLRGKLRLRFEDRGEQRVKNIPEPVRAYRLRPEAQVPATPISTPQAIDLSLPNKPSIAVLPFNNLSGDPDQDYFADGMTEDIITGLSRFRSLFVIARNSSFAYKGKSPDVREVARDLGIRYVVEGSVRRVGERIRITGQLIDAETGNHLWAERYDRELENIFAVQDEVTEAIVAAIAPEIDDVERKRAQRKPPDTLDAWGLYQRGLAVSYASTDEGLRSAIEQFDRVNALDPTFAPAFAMAANARRRYALHFMPDDHDELLHQAREKAYQAIALDPRDPLGRWSAAAVHSMLGQHDIAIAECEEAIALNPNDATARYFLGAALCSADRSKEAIAHIDHAIRLSPRDIYLTGMLTHRAFVLFDLERYDEAFEWAQRARLSPNPRTMTFALLVAVLTTLGRIDEARTALKDLLAHAPRTSCAKYRENPFGGPKVMKRFVDALREAGLPE